MMLKNAHKTGFHSLAISYIILPHDLVIMQFCIYPNELKTCVHTKATQWCLLQQFYKAAIPKFCKLGNNHDDLQ